MQLLHFFILKRNRGNLFPTLSGFMNLITLVKRDVLLFSGMEASDRKQLSLPFFSQKRMPANEASVIITESNNKQQRGLICKPASTALNNHVSQLWIETRGSRSTNRHRRQARKLAQRLRNRSGVAHLQAPMYYACLGLLG